MPSSDQEESLIDHAFRGNVNQVRDLLLAGVNVNARRDDGTTALYIASEQGHVEVVNALLEQKNVDVNSQRNDDGSTALYMASQAGHVEVVNVLLENNNVNVLVKHDDGSTAVDVAQRFHAIKTAFRQHTKDLQAVEQDRKSLRNAMGIDPARPVVELSYQYIKRYITNRKLGGGVFGDAFLAEDCHLPEQTMFVVKMIKLSQSSNGPSDDARKAFQNELSALKRFRHPNIIAVYGYNLKHTQQFLVYEYAARGSLDGFFKNEGTRAFLPAAKRLSIMFELARAVRFLHTGGCDGWTLFHRDIKSANISLDEHFRARLTDCGLAKFVPDENSEIIPGSFILTGSSEGTLVGTPGYMCPEYITKKANGWACPFIPAYDVFSIGVVCAELILGRLNLDQTRKREERVNVFQMYVKNEETVIVDGWRQLIRDADTTVRWKPDALEQVCKTAIGCMAPSPERLSTDDLLPQLIKALNLEDGIRYTEPEGEGMNPPPIKRPRTEDLIHTTSWIQLNPCVLNSEPEVAGRLPCATCNETTTVIVCSARKPYKPLEPHALCYSCIHAAFSNARSSTGSFQLSCPIDGCSSKPLKKEDLMFVIHPNAWSACFVESRIESLESKVDGVKQDLDEIKERLTKLARVFDSCLPGWAKLNEYANKLKLCPNLVMLTPKAVDGPINLKEWFSRLGKQTYEVVFYCAHSGEPGHDPFEISVNRKWVVKVLPWLQIVLDIAAELDPTKVASAVISAFPIVKHSKEMKALIDELKKEEKHGEKQNLEGMVALEAIAGKANKPENLQYWEGKLVSVFNENERTIWVKNKEEYKTFYSASLRTKLPVDLLDHSG